MNSSLGLFDHLPQFNPLNYPRKNTPKYFTDVIIIQYLYYKDFFMKFFNDIEKCYAHHYSGKEYFMTFSIPNGTKSYSSRDIIHLLNNSDKYIPNNRNYLDYYVILYFKLKKFIMSIYESYNIARDSYATQKTFNYICNPPANIYKINNTMIPTNIYDQNEMNELMATIVYMKKNNKTISFPFFN